MWLLVVTRLMIRARSTWAWRVRRARPELLVFPDHVGVAAVDRLAVSIRACVTVRRGTRARGRGVTVRRGTRLRGPGVAVGSRPAVVAWWLVRPVARRVDVAVRGPGTVAGIAAVSVAGIAVPWCRRLLGTVCAGSGIRRAADVTRIGIVSGVTGTLRVGRRVGTVARSGWMSWRDSVARTRAVSRTGWVSVAPTVSRAGDVTGTAAVARTSSPTRDAAVVRTNSSTRDAAVAVLRASRRAPTIAGRG